jgi:hypothetical protein
MAEIRFPVTQLIEGDTYIAGPEEYLITERHTICDVLRFLIDKSGGVDELKFLIDLKMYE